jgi:hypothetical protein
VLLLALRFPSQAHSFYFAFISSNATYLLLLIDWKNESLFVYDYRTSFLKDDWSLVAEYLVDDAKKGSKLRDDKEKGRNNNSGSRNRTKNLLLRAARWGRR